MKKIISFLGTYVIGTYTIIGLFYTINKFNTIKNRKV